MARRNPPPRDQAGRQSIRQGYSRNRGCRAKTSWLTLEQARKVMRQLIAQGAAPERVAVYGRNGGSTTQPCQFCNGWHVGHQMTRRT